MAEVDPRKAIEEVADELSKVLSGKRVETFDPLEYLSQKFPEYSPDLVIGGMIRGLFISACYTYYGLAQAVKDKSVPNPDTYTGDLVNDMLKTFNERVKHYGKLPPKGKEKMN